MSLKADKPFHFYTRHDLTFLTGRTATNLSELFEGIKDASEASIYHHTHHFVVRHEFLSPEPPNDFAYWISNLMQDKVLGEEVASIDLREYSSLQDIRTRILEVIGRSKERDASRFGLHAPAGGEFHFMKTQSFVLPTNHIAHDLVEFKQCLEQVSIDSIYFHVFEARLREREYDCSLWLSSSMHEENLARELQQFDPYTQTLDNLRRTLIRLVEQRIMRTQHGDPSGV